MNQSRCASSETSLNGSSPETSGSKYLIPSRASEETDMKYKIFIPNFLSNFFIKKLSRNILMYASCSIEMDIKLERNFHFFMYNTLSAAAHA